MEYGKVMRRFRTARLTALVLVCLMALSSCSGGAYKLTYENGAYRNEKKQAAFIEASGNYLAASYYPEEIVARIRTKSGERALYAIEGMDAKLWLSDENYTVFYSESVTLPALWEMDVNLIMLNRNGVFAYLNPTIENAAEIEDVVDTIQNGTTIPRDKVVFEPVSRDKLLFSSGTYPGLRYALEYWVFEKDVDIYETLTDGRPTNDYPGTLEIVNGEAVFHLGTDVLVYDRDAEVFYSFGSVLKTYFDSGNTAQF